MTTRRWAPAPIAVAVAAITTVRITITLLVVARIAPTAVTITTVPMVTIVPITVIATVTTIVRIAVGRAAVSHIFARGRGMRPISHGIIDTDPASVQILGINKIKRNKRNLVTKGTHDAI